MKSMRIVLSIFLALFIAGKASSQLSVIIFSEKGEKFTAYVNGSPVNDKPASRVESDRPGGPSFKLKVLFEDSSIPEISKSIFNTPGPDLFYVIKKSDKGKYILEKTSSEYVHQDENLAVQKESNDVKEEKAKTDEIKSEAKPAGGSGKGCSNPMEAPDFYASREMISNAPFDGPKLTQAKSLSDKNCLTTSQIIDVIYIFSGESSRLNFAKYAYNHCWDPDNYNDVKEVLNSSGQSALQKYIDSLK
jgi:hypothetical protein